MKPTSAGAVALFLGSLWMIAKFAVQWHYHIGFESRRQQEARLLVEAVCDTVEGASLANEFAKCEQARIIMRNTRVVWVKAFEKTMESTLAQALEVFGRTSATTAWNVSLCAALVCGIGLMCKFTTDVLQRGSTDMDLFSPIAQHRMLATSYVDVGSPGSRNLEHKKII